MNWLKPLNVNQICTPNVLKKLWLLLVIVVVSMCTTESFAQKIEHVFRRYKNDQQVWYSNYKGDVSQFLQSSGSEKIESKIEAFDFYMFNKGTDVSASDKQKIEKAKQAEKYELLVQIRQNDVAFKAFGIGTGDSLSKIYVESAMDGKPLYVFLHGAIKMKELEKIVSGFQKMNK